MSRVLSDSEVRGIARRVRNTRAVELQKLPQWPEPFGELVITPDPERPTFGTFYDTLGVIQGRGEKCQACQLWINTLDANHRAGAMNDHGQFKCGTCLRERKPFTMKPVVEDNGRVVEVPEEYGLITLNHLRDHDGKPVGTRVAKWPVKEPFMMIFGRPGAGKTAACYVLERHAMKQGMECWHLSAPAAQLRWQGAVLNNGRQRVLNIWINVPRLILDDLSACTPSDEWAQTIHVLMDERRKAKRPLLLTAAADSKELGRRYTGAIFSRLKFYEQVELQPIDRRAK